MYRIVNFALALLLLFAQQTIAQDGFRDDFSDMNVMDDNPVTWSPIGDSTLDASSGDLVVNGRVQLENVPDPNWRFSGASVMSTFSDVSLRTQARLAQDNSWIAISVRENNDPIGNGYGFSINAFGVLSYGRLADPPVNDNLLQLQTDFRPTQEDVVMQVDVIGNTIDIWAWRPDEEMPASPLTTMNDTTFDSGFVSAWVGGVGPDRDMSGTFRYVQVATQSIPEPGASVLLAIGFAFIAARSRRQSRD